MNEIAHEGSVSALLVGELEDDRALVRDIFGKLGWRLFEARNGHRAMAWLERNAVEVVIAEGSSLGAGWQRLLDALRDLPDPPQLVVTSRTADDFLWSEVLNRGGYDVLPRPLNRDEVERVIAGAGRQFRSLRDGPAQRVAAGTAA
jgi:DNA-binding response OmpR family regulator